MTEANRSTPLPNGRGSLAGAGSLVAAPLAGRPTLEFDGKNTYIEVPKWKYAGDTPLTLEAWVRPGEMGDSINAELFHELSPEARKGIEIHRVIHDGEPHWQFQVGVGELRSFGGPAPSHRLAHLAAVYDGKLQISLYLDGKLGRPRKLPGKIIPAEGPFWIGAFWAPKNKNGIAAPFNGTIAEVRISKVVRYDADFTPQTRLEPDADTVLLYHLDEGTGDVAHDASGHGYDAKIVAAHWLPAGDLTTATATTATATRDHYEPRP